MPYTKGRKRREQVLQTARSLFATKGFGNVSMADIAAECNVARTTLYDYFQTKEDILLELLDEVVTAARSTEPVGSNTYEKLCYLASDSLQKVKENRLVYRIVFQESSKLALVAGERMQQMAENWGNHIRRTLSEGRDELLSSVTLGDVVSAYQALVGTWGQMMVLSDEDFDVEAKARDLVSMLWFGVGKRGKDE